MESLIKLRDRKFAWQETCAQVKRLNRMFEDLNHNAEGLYDLQDLKAFNRVRSELNKVSISIAHANTVLGSIAYALNAKRF